MVLERAALLQHCCQNRAFVFLQELWEEQQQYVRGKEQHVGLEVGSAGVGGRGCRLGCFTLLIQSPLGGWDQGGIHKGLKACWMAAPATFRGCWTQACPHASAACRHTCEQLHASNWSHDPTSCAGARAPHNHQGTYASKWACLLTGPPPNDRVRAVSWK